MKNSLTDHVSTITAIEAKLRTEFGSDATGHDWWHLYRVRNTAIELGKSEGANLIRIELAALLHDLDDHKFNDNSDGESTPKARKWLQEAEIPQPEIEEICHVIQQVSFKGAGVETGTDSIEAACVQDADRLDAIGALGIARTFAYGGSKEQPIYDPELAPVLHNSFDNYKKTRTSTINHFYEKLLLLKDRMQTDSGKKLAEKRHRFMVEFLNEFMEEWG